MNEPTNQEPAGDEPQDAFGRWVLPYFEDSALWPVLLVVVAVLAATLTPVLLNAIRHLDLRAILATLVLLIATGRGIRWEWRTRGRPGGVSASLVAIWVMALAAVVYGSRTGLL